MGQKGRLASLKMALKPYVLWINTENGSLTAGEGQERTVESPFFIQGDNAKIELHFLKRLDGVLRETTLDDGASVRVGVGQREARPTAGTYYLSYASQNTTDLHYNSTAAQIQTALNALASVTSEGGLTVEAVGDGFLIKWNTGTNHTAITGNAEALFPKSICRITPLDGAVEQTVYFHLAQSVIAFSDQWSTFPNCTADLTTETPYSSGIAKVQRLVVTSTPSYGYFNIAVYRTSTTMNPMGYATIDLTMSSGEIKEAIASQITDTNGLPNPGVLLDVVRVDDYTFDFIFSNDTDLWLGGANLVTSKGVFGTLSFNTVECHQFLSGADSKETVLEVMIVTNAGQQTLLQIPVIIYSDVIDAASLSPLNLDTPLGEQTANARFVRRDVGQNPTDPEKNIIWSNLGLIGKTGVNVAAALSNANNPTAGNPLLTQSDIAGLSSTWGSITGDIQSQTDLIGLFDLKAPLLNPAFSADATVAGRVGIGGPVANNTAHKLAIYNGNIVFSAGYGLAFGDGTTQTTAFPGFAGYFNLTGSSQVITGANTFSGIQTFNAAPVFNQGTKGAFNIQYTFPDPIEANLNDGDIFRATTNGNLLGYRNGNVNRYFVFDNQLASKANLTGANFTGTITTPKIGVNGAASLNPYTLIKVTGGDIELDGGSYGITFGSEGKQTKPGMPISGGFFTGGVTMKSADGINTYFNVGPNGSNPSTTANGGAVWYDSINRRLMFGTGILNVQVAGQNFANAFTDVQTISVNSSSAALRVTQTGAGNCLVVEDSANPDATAFVINANGAVGIQQSSTWTPAAGVVLDVVGNSFFNGKGTFTPVSGVAGINIGTGGTDTASTTAGDLWITSGGVSLNFRDGTGSWRQCLTTSSAGIIDINSTSTALRVTQRGTGEAFRVEDSTTPDSTPFIINADGAVGIGVLPGIYKLNVTGSTNITGTLTVTGELNAQDRVNVGTNGIIFNLGGQLRGLNVASNPNTQGNFDANLYPNEIIIELSPGNTYAIPARQITN